MIERTSHNGSIRADLNGHPAGLLLGRPMASCAHRALVRVGDRSVAPTLRSKALDATDRKVAEELNVAASRLGG